MTRFRFRIVKRGPKVDIQHYLDAEDEAVIAGYASQGWATLISGFSSVEQARTEFGRMYGTQDIEWQDGASGTFRAFDAAVPA